MEARFFKSDNPLVLAKAVKQAIKQDAGNQLKEKMRQGEKYYNYQHDIENFKIIFIDNEGVAREETSRSNIKIAHPYFTELVDQKVQYLLSNPVEAKTDDVELKELLKPYINEHFQVVLQESLEGASKKAYEFVYAYVNADNRIAFETADALKVIEIFDENNQRTGLIRSYTTDILKDGKIVKVTKAEYWNSEETWYFVTDDQKDYILDPSQDPNPRKHILIEDEKGTSYGKGFGFIPFYKLMNNKNNRTDLEPIKDIIDDYDLMACSLSNNLSDFDQPFYAVRGFDGENYETLVNNIKARRVVGVGENGAVDIKTVDIPVEARKAKLAIDKEGIYKFGMGFDSAQVGDGNITNVVIKSRYSLLDLKCNKAEIRLRQLIRWMLDLIVQDINEKNGKAYKSSDIDIVITRDTMVNESDLINDEKTAVETKQIMLQSILDMAHLLDDETVLKQVCEVYDLDFEEVQKRLGEQDYEPTDVKANE